MKEIAKITEPKTLTEIVKVAPTLPTIGKLIREGGNPLESVQVSLTLIYTMYGYKSETKELELISSVFLDNAKQLTMADITLFTKKSLAGYYNDKYKPKFQPSYVMEWLTKYKEERMEAAETISTVKAPENTPLTPRAKEIITELLEMTKPIYSTDVIPESDYIKEAKKKQQAIELEFERLWNEQGCNETEGNNPRKYVQVDGWFDSIDLSNGKVSKQFISGRNLFKDDFISFKFEQVNKIIK